MDFSYPKSRRADTTTPFKMAQLPDNDENKPKDQNFWFNFNIRDMNVRIARLERGVVDYPGQPEATRRFLRLVEEDLDPTKPDQLAAYNAVKERLENVILFLQQQPAPMAD